MIKRLGFSLGLVFGAAGLAACGDNSSAVAPDAGAPADAPIGTVYPPWLIDPHVLVDGTHATSDMCTSMVCVHNENTDMIVFNGSTFLVHRTAESQVLGPNSSLRIYHSEDHGQSWSEPVILPAIEGRDLRDPAFYIVDGKLALKALTRLPVFSTRDTGVDSITVGSMSPDGGQTWSPLAHMAPETWSFWRIKQDPATGMFYSAAYEDGDASIKLYSSIDGTNWTAGAVVYGVSADTPLEAELVFMPTGKLLAFFRMDGSDDELLGNVGRIRTRVCWASAPYTDWDCAHELDGQRLDGPVAFFHGSRLFVVARKNFLDPSDRKRTSLFELTGDFNGGDLQVIEHGELPSTGDTAYAGIAAIDADRYLVTWYSSPLALDGPWSRAIFEATDIWQATLDMSKVDLPGPVQNP